MDVRLPHPALRERDGARGGHLRAGTAKRRPLLSRARIDY